MSLSGRHHGADPLTFSGGSSFSYKCLITTHLDRQASDPFPPFMFRCGARAVSGTACTTNAKSFVVGIPKA
jgi:hypothetical protein